MIFFYYCSNTQSKKETTSLPGNEKTIQESSIEFESIIGILSFDDVSNKTSEFIRYSRNQYFAEKGYVFQDSNLNIFFENQGWYKPIKNNQMEFDTSTKSIIDSLKKIEENIDSIEYQKILFKYTFNNYPLYYIAWKPDIINGRPDRYDYGAFVLMDTNMNWTLSIPSIPVEYLVENCLKKISCTDVEALRNEQIYFKNIDKNCKNGELDEIIINKEGPSNDYQDVIYGFNSKLEFDILFDKSGKIDFIEPINDSILKFSTTERCDLIGTMDCTRYYNYNTITKSSEKLPYDFEEIDINSYALDTVNIYNESMDSIITIVKPNESVCIIKILEKEGYKIRTSTKEGWINRYQLNSFNICRAD